MEMEAAVHFTCKWTAGPYKPNHRDNKDPFTLPSLKCKKVLKKNDQPLQECRWPERHQWEPDSQTRATQVPQLEQPPLLEMEEWLPEDDPPCYPVPEDRQEGRCVQYALLLGQDSQWRLHSRSRWPAGRRRGGRRGRRWPPRGPVHLLPEAVWIHVAARGQQVLPAHIWQS